MTRKPAIYQYAVIHAPSDEVPEILRFDAGEVVNVVVPDGTENPDNFVRMYAMRAIAGEHPDLGVRHLEIVVRPFAC